jgi:cellulose biosynthesis protein BcsQ
VGKRPYILVLASHKGGTGRTTCALALAYLWGQAGLNVALIDADPVGAAHAVALAPGGNCAWKQVKFFASIPDGGRGLLGSNLILIDCPPLTEPSAQRVLRMADGVVLSVLANPLSMRTIPTAASALEHARGHNPRLNLLGLLVGIYHEQDELQTAMLHEIRQVHGNLLLEPAIPYQQEVRDWPLNPGSPLPEGPAREAYAALTGLLEPALTPVAAVSP